MHAWRAQMHASRAHVHASRAHAVTDTCVEEREAWPTTSPMARAPTPPDPASSCQWSQAKSRSHALPLITLGLRAAHIKRSVGCGSSNWRKQKGSRLKVDIVIVDSRARCAKEPAGRRAAMLRMQVGEHTEVMFRKVRRVCHAIFFAANGRRWSCR